MNKQINVYDDYIEIPKETKESGYKKFYNKDLQCPYLTNEELGMLHYLLSKPKTWNFSKEQILKERNEEYQVITEYEYDKIMKSLKTLGFVKTESLGKNKDGTYCWKTRICINPFDSRVFDSKEIDKLLPKRQQELEKRKSKNT